MDSPKRVPPPTAASSASKRVPPYPESRVGRFIMTPPVRYPRQAAWRFTVTYQYATRQGQKRRPATTPAHNDKRNKDQDTSRMSVNLRRPKLRPGSVPTPRPGVVARYSGNPEGPPPRISGAHPICAGSADPDYEIGSRRWFCSVRIESPAWIFLNMKESSSSRGSGFRYPPV